MNYKIHTVSVMHYLNLRLASNITRVYVGDDFEVFKRGWWGSRYKDKTLYAYYVVGLTKEDISVLTADDEDQNEFENWVEQNYENLYEYTLMEEL